MKRALKLIAAALVILLLVATGVLTWMWQARLPQRAGTLAMDGLKAPVQVRYDEHGVPHIRAENEADLYRALGYVHAQDRLFQMEVLRRLARGELAEVLGPKLVDTDRLFRSLTIRDHADAAAARLDPASPATQGLQAYLDGINQFQANNPAPIEFELLDIPKRPFTLADTLSVGGYLAYSFAAGFRTEPVLTRIRDELGTDHLGIFDLAWHPEGVNQGVKQAGAPSGPAAVRSAPASAPASASASASAPAPERAPSLPAAPAASATSPAIPATPATPASPASGMVLNRADWNDLNRLAALGQDALQMAGVPAFEGSNAWVISGARAAGGKPLLAGDPHIAFSVPAVWYEAHLSMPGFELYGHHQALNPFALLGHNPRFGWTLTMFQNDDLDLVAEKVNPGNPKQVWANGAWADLQERQETIRVKGQADVTITLRRSPHGPIVNDALDKTAGSRPIAMWWGLLNTENPILDAFYQLNRAETLDKARSAASMIHAPGLNVVWANAAGDIAWWAAARLPLRPYGVNPAFILDGGSAESDKAGFLPFAQNPREENPQRGYIVSANQQPAGQTPLPGYYNLWDRAQRLDQQLAARPTGWDTPAMQALQLDTQTGQGPRTLAPLMEELRAAAVDPADKALVEQLAAWRGDHPVDAVAPTLFAQFLFEMAREAMADELGDDGFNLLRRTRALDHALPRLAADAASPWWDRRGTPAQETRAEVVKAAWLKTVAHLKATLGADPSRWTWGRAHQVTHEHPLGKQAPLDRLFNVGPFAVPGAREVPNNLSAAVGPVPLAVNSGPSTRRVIDFAQPAAARGILPVGQSGVWGDRHHADQADAYHRGESRPQHLDAADVVSHTRITLTLVPR
jgi:penicillin amidase